MLNIWEWFVRRAFQRANITLNGSGIADPQIHDARFYRRLAVWSSLGLGESFMEGWWSCQRPDLFIEKLIRSGVAQDGLKLRDFFVAVRDFCVNQYTYHRSRRVAEVHYDITPELYRLMLGTTLVYTCARYCTGAESLSQAQLQKVDLLCRKAGLSKDERVLDIGSGWGSTLARAHRAFGVSGTGISISKGQLEYARTEYPEIPIEFLDQDYRDLSVERNGLFNAILSVCMIEHVGSPERLRDYFAKARSVLHPDGTFVLQCIVSQTNQVAPDAFLEKYIFPGGRLMTYEGLREGMAGHFKMVDCEEFGDDYVRTLSEWLYNVRCHKQAFVSEIGEKGFRMFEHYLNSCIGYFRSEHGTVVQLVLKSTEWEGQYKPVRL